MEIIPFEFKQHHTLVQNLDNQIYPNHYIDIDFNFVNGYVCVEQGILIGYILYKYLTSDSIYITELAVAPDHREKRLGSRLVEIVVKEHADKLLFLHIEFQEDEYKYNKLRSFYNKFGFNQLYYAQKYAILCKQPLCVESNFQKYFKPIDLEFKKCIDVIT